MCKQDVRWHCVNTRPSEAGGWGGGGWGSPGRPTFLALFVELRTFNTCRFCHVSVMTDQTPKPAIGAKQKPLSSAWTLRTSVVKCSFRLAFVVRHAGDRGFTMRNTRLLFYLTLTCATAYQHFRSIVKFTFHAHKRWARLRDDAEMSADCLRG